MTMRRRLPNRRRNETFSLLWLNIRFTATISCFSDGAVAEIFISAQGNWTIVATLPNGMICMIGSGQAWQPAVAHDDTI